jgi:eukaryotic-like serine/threonine-protein kinase
VSTASDRLAAALADRYRIERELGQGGMATVYLAEDLRHRRRVALKVLRPELAAVIGAERFLKEIETTANLQHPHILPLFDSGIADTFLFYVMPYVEGESLRDRLAREKQLPVDDAVNIAREVLSALDYAHRHAVIHRDIKPENILLHDGSALVADFGIALAVSSAGGGTRMTETGMSLGTPHYMSPEQAMGERELTARSDVYALGCVLYEMLSGEPPFTGPTPQAILARVVTEEPRSLTLQRRTIPPHVEAAVLASLQKLPADRFASAAQFAEALAGKGAVPARTASREAAATPRRSRALPGTAGVIVAVLAAGLGWWLRGTRAPALAAPPVRFAFTLARPGGDFHLAISPDGRTVVQAVADSDRVSRLYARELGSTEARPIPGTEGAQRPVFSPDGQWLLVGKGGKLFKIRLTGGAPIEVRDSVVSDFAWGPGDMLVFRHSVADGLWRVPISGGTPERLTTPDTAREELGHWRPQVLPNGKAVLFTVFSTPTRTSIGAYEFKSKRRVTLVEGGAIFGRYAGSGHLLYWKKGTLFAIGFDPDRLEVHGAALPVVEDVAGEQTGGDAAYAVAPNGTLAYMRASEWNRPASVVWADRAGRETPALPAPGSYRAAALSPDGRSIALVVKNPNQNIWLYDLGRGTTTPLTTGEATAFSPVWSPDGASIFFTYETPAYDVYRIATDGGSPPKPVVADPNDKYPVAVSHDGRTLLYREDPPNRLKVFSLDGNTAPRPFTESSLPETGASISPDGKWVAYGADVGGDRRPEIFLRALEGGARRQLSVNGGSWATWMPSGHELVYLAGDSVLSVTLNPAAGTAAAPALLFRKAGILSFDVAPDGKRFLLVVPVDRPGALPMTVVVNWFTELREKMTTR